MQWSEDSKKIYRKKKEEWNRRTEWEEERGKRTEESEVKMLSWDNKKRSKKKRSSKCFFISAFCKLYLFIYFEWFCECGKYNTIELHHHFGIVCFSSEKNKKKKRKREEDESMHALVVLSLIINGSGVVFWILPACLHWIKKLRL